MPRTRSREHAWLITALTLIATAPLSATAENNELKNWFGDPFFQVRSALPACPLPLGPLLTEKQTGKEAHYRAERGTTCWLSGRCDKPNAYLYDPEIADAVRIRFDDAALLREASLWITVQRRFVFVDGCVPARYRPGSIEKELRSIPNVEHVIVNVMHGTAGKPPYQTLAGERAR